MCRPGLAPLAVMDWLQSSAGTQSPLLSQWGFLQSWGPGTRTPGPCPRYGSLCLCPWPRPALGSCDLGAGTPTAPSCPVPASTAGSAQG